MPGIGFVIPTRDRPDELARTLDLIGAYPAEQLGREPAHVVIVDNGSRTPASEHVPRRLENGARVEVVRLDTNRGAAARNIGAERAESSWIVMLDDDSAPIRGDFARVLNGVPGSVAAVGGEIVLSDGRREAGGLPEVVIGCGCAVRRDVFLELGGYDERFGYYAEEYDLCAKMIASGRSVVHTRDLAFCHRKVTAGRDFGAILFRLVRNNAWVMARHAPDLVRQSSVDAIFDRYAQIAEKESVSDAFERARDEAVHTLEAQHRSPLSAEGWSRFIGEAAMIDGAIRRCTEHSIGRVRLIEPGKGEDTVRRVLAEHGIGVDDAASDAVIGTLSPGPMLDALDRNPGAIAPWSFGVAHGINGDGG